MHACNCGHKGAEGLQSEDLKTHIQLTVPVTSEARYIAAGYVVVDRDEYMITIRKNLLPLPPEPPPKRILGC